MLVVDGGGLPAAAANNGAQGNSFHTQRRENTGEGSCSWWAVVFCASAVRAMGGSSCCEVVRGGTEGCVAVRWCDHFAVFSHTILRVGVVEGECESWPQRVSLRTERRKAQTTRALGENERTASSLLRTKTHDRNTEPFGDKPFGVMRVCEDVTRNRAKALSLPGAWPLRGLLFSKKKE